MPTEDSPLVSPAAAEGDGTILGEKQEIKKQYPPSKTECGGSNIHHPWKRPLSKGVYELHCHSCRSDPRISQKQQHYNIWEIVTLNCFTLLKSYWSFLTCFFFLDSAVMSRVNPLILSRSLNSTTLLPSVVDGDSTSATCRSPPVCLFPISLILWTWKRNGECQVQS